MPLFTTLVLSTAVTMLPQGELKLPPVQQQPKAKAAAPNDPEAFRRALLELRTAGDQYDTKIQTLPQRFGDLEAMVLQGVRTAKGREMLDLLGVARRFGTAKDTGGTTWKQVGDELLFQLLSRPLNDATRDVMAVMGQLKGSEGRPAIKECVHSRIPAVRRAAIDTLAVQAGPEDLPLALELAADQALDLRLSGIDLLGAIRDKRAQERLVELLAKEPTVAGAACAQLLKQGAEAAPVLQQALKEPPIDRAHAYAAFVLAQAQTQSGKDLLPASAIDGLKRDLDSSDVTTRCLAAVAMAELAFHSDDPDPQRCRDADVVATLLLLTSNEVFVPNLSLLREAAEPRLVALTGRMSGADGLTWSEWWKGAKDGFQALRARVRVDAANARLAVLELRTERRRLRLIGEDLAGTPPNAGADEIVLAQAEVLQLVQQLEKLGFMAAGPRERAQPVQRTLQLQVQGARCQSTAPNAGAPVFDSFAAAVEGVLETESWQLFRDPDSEPDRAAFWRAERRWLEANPQPVEQGRRFLQRVVKVWPRTTPIRRTAALAWLFARPDKQNLLREEDGLRILDLVGQAEALAPDDLLLLELAAASAGDQVWRRCIDVASRKKGGGRPAVARLFGLLGPDRVLQALDDERPVVRQAALDEVVRMRDGRAGPQIVARLDDAEPAVRRAAAFAAGMLAVSEARERVIALIAADDTEPLLRRECLRGLGRIGGAGAFNVLQRAMASPVKEDRDAALRGIGELHEDRAAALMADLLVASAGNETGDLARFYLQRMGPLLAVPALRPRLQVTNPAARLEVVLLLGSMQDPQVVPELIGMLRSGTDNLRTLEMLEGTTGLDVKNADDRINALEQWWRNNRGVQQYHWLLASLRSSKVPTTLKPEQFEAGAGLAAVPELARLLVEAPEPRHRVLAATVLRTLANEDYGAVTWQTQPAALEQIAARYRILYEGAKAAASGK
jgi:HEAT repeat protein